MATYQRGVLLGHGIFAVMVGGGQLIKLVPEFAGTSSDQVLSFHAVACILTALATLVAGEGMVFAAINRVPVPDVVAEALMWFPLASFLPDLTAEAPLLLVAGAAVLFGRFAADRLLWWGPREQDKEAAAVGSTETIGLRGCAAILEEDGGVRAVKNVES